ncbi:unnamed protein product [Linum trigynum]|uniref:Uncharacterized protein n=1 Tax=Linum trigynum TaxID=586398 RepID=A0AAV2GGZ7_9ROSI
MLRLLERTKYVDHTFHECKDAVDGVIEVVRNSYYTELDISSELLSNVILVDACFLLEVFFTNIGIMNSGIRSGDEDFMSANEYKKILTSSGLRRDLALLENQLPFFVLERLFEVICRCLEEPIGIQGISLPGIAFSIFKRDFNCHHKVFRLGTAKEHPNYRHLLDLISNYTRPSSSSSPDPALSPRPLPMSQQSPTVHLRNAKKLSEAGIHFEKAEENMLLDIEFCSGVFRIPPLVINECTESLLRNLMAFEHNSCNPEDPTYPHDEYCASHVFLMERLISHKEDLDTMESKGIIINQMGGREDTYKIFHNISQNFVLKNFYFGELCSSIEAYCESRRNRCLLELRKKHLKSPWTTLSVVGGTILLIFTAIQTIYTVLSYLNR